MGEEAGSESEKGRFRVQWCVFSYPWLDLASSDYGTDDADAARRKYKKDLDHIKPDLESYNRQKEIALGLTAGSLSKKGGTSSAITDFAPSNGALQVRFRYIIL